MAYLFVEVQIVLTVQSLQTIKDFSDLTAVNVADISHEVCNLRVVSQSIHNIAVLSYISLVVSNLLVNVVTTKNLVD
jgi:hypothetical protein